ncbi:hypothetical protein XENORESO_008026 [Xenotaenia resolanae]|uniref:Secreted protein n=1 Tax=Xenotaenia resolanae TaxID=208358 RepID=A0ABV0W957_9TELE
MKLHTTAAALTTAVDCCLHLVFFRDILLCLCPTFCRPFCPLRDTTFEAMMTSSRRRFQRCSNVADI